MHVTRCPCETMLAPATEGFETILASLGLANGRTRHNMPTRGAETTAEQRPVLKKGAVASQSRRHEDVQVATRTPCVSSTGRSEPSPDPAKCETPCMLFPSAWARSGFGKGEAEHASKSDVISKASATSRQVALDVRGRGATECKTGTQAAVVSSFPVFRECYAVLWFLCLTMLCYDYLE